MGAPHQDHELELVTELCRQLAELGLSVGLSDARPAVMIRSPASWWITVDPSGEFFEWDESRHQYPVTDLAGAARLISEHANAQRPGVGEVS